ncbi:hypothetical protein B0H17DRAFT_1210735 [Mycena rosella]|uniref:Uncharacterized protein n=1 Tax=Mycena rosella TaxID=1033263 RepID=A0AAD7G4R3_MYCRO|nr:hypothetical protein B0H17DRAFT_1210735 [Mycena rosella]
MAKFKSRRKVIPNDADEYAPGRSAEEKAVGHRKAVARHYARNPQIREARRVQVADKRAATKLKKRKQYHPKNSTPLIAAHDENELGPAEDNHWFFDPRAGSYFDGESQPRNIVPGMDGASDSHGAVGTTGASLTSNERAACDALATLAQGVGRSASLADREKSVDSVLERAMLLSSLDNDDSEQTLAKIPQHTPVGRIDPRRFSSGVTPLSTHQHQQLVAGALVLTSVQIAQIRVAELNSGKLTPPTTEERIRWCLQAERVGGFRVVHFTYSQQCAVDHWRIVVNSAVLREVRRQRLEAAQQSVIEFEAPN